MGVRISTGRRASALLAIFLCIELLDEVVDGLMGAAWPLIRHDLALSYVEIGLLLTVPSLVAHVVEPAVGLLADGKRRFAAIALGGCAFATAMILVAGATSFLYVLAALVVFYPASGTFVSLSQSSLMDLRPDDEERNMVLWTVAGGLGVALGPILLGFALWADGSWRDVFLVVGALSLGATVAVWLLRPRRAFVVEDDDEPHVLRRAWHAVRCHHRRCRCCGARLRHLSRRG